MHPVFTVCPSAVIDGAPVPYGAVYEYSISTILYSTLHSDEVRLSRGYAISCHHVKGSRNDVCRCGK